MEKYFNIIESDPDAPESAGILILFALYTPDSSLNAAFSRTPCDIHGVNNRLEFSKAAVHHIDSVVCS